MSTVLTGDRPDIEALAANAVRVTVEVIWAPFVSGDYLAGLSPVGLGPLIKTLVRYAGRTLVLAQSRGSSASPSDSSLLAPRMTAL